MSDLEDYNDSEAEEDLSIRSLEVTKSPSQEELVSLLECPVCFELPLPPLRTCYQGHILCVNCCDKISICPLCQKPFGIGRNYFAETFLNTCTMKCRYYPDGCTVEAPGSKIRNHMDRCNYRPLKCRECSKKVAFSDIDGHLQQAHGIGRWDLNDEGKRIISCHKLRTGNPYAEIIEPLSTKVYFSGLFIGILFAIAADHFYFQAGQQ